MIDERAIIDPKAVIGKDVTIGPWTLIGPDVTIGDGTTIGSHVVIKGPTRIGKNNQIMQFASLGEAPQDKKYANEPTELIIGDNNVIREYCNFNRGTMQGIEKTIIGNNNLFMANVHIAHDCVVGNHIIMANNSSLAGHVEVDDFAILSGYIGVHQFCQIGRYAFISHGMLITKDVPPFLMVAGGRRNGAAGINSEGLRRHGFSKDAIQKIKTAYKILYLRGLNLDEASAQISEMATELPELKPMVDFLGKTKRGIIA